MKWIKSRSWDPSLSIFLSLHAEAQKGKRAYYTTERDDIARGNLICRSARCKIIACDLAALQADLGITETAALAEAGLIRVDLGAWVALTIAGGSYDACVCAYLSLRLQLRGGQSRKYDGEEEGKAEAHNWAVWPIFEGRRALYR